MKRLSNIGTLLKKIYRLYVGELHYGLQEKGFTDLRPSFLEVLIKICDEEGASIKEIGESCGLKKQTMTSHLNELEKRGYIVRRTSVRDKRAQQVFLTEYGEKFKLSLYEVIEELEKSYVNKLGEVEMDRVEHTLSGLHNKVAPSINSQISEKIFSQSDMFFQ